MPFTFAKGHLSLQGLFFMTLYFAKSQALAVFVYKSYGSCESWRSSGFGGDDEAAKLTVFSSELPCLSRIFWSTTCFIPGSSLRYSRRSFSFCDNPLALIFAEDDELFSFFTSCLLGVAGALAFSNKCKLCSVNLRLPCLQKNSTFSLPQSLVLNSGHHLIL